MKLDLKAVEFLLVRALEYLPDLDGGTLKRSHGGQQEWRLPSWWAPPCEPGGGWGCCLEHPPISVTDQIPLDNNLMDEDRVSWAVSLKVVTQTWNFVVAVYAVRI